ncbi:hypothetical protein BT96DRAFT_1010333 [Gymnopus androsaceus JB14]|uniref:Uncharacterized protein n=1 Tax=Gymnopus androsaceus JB14 TaxID=1447944 RepID=A0A6A4GAX2_9AGAR|nr:hypothetical protein BT96DRAFT_1010333 [Gymnopus androsaceus JB14]
MCRKITTWASQSVVRAALFTPIRIYHRYHSKGGMLEWVMYAAVALVALGSIINRAAWPCQSL